MHTAGLKAVQPSHVAKTVTEASSGNLQSAPRPQDEEDYSDEAPEFVTEHEQQQEADSEPEREPLKNRLPPLPERPPAGKRRTGKASSATSSRQEDNQDAKPSGQAESGRKTASGETQPLSSLHILCINRLSWARSSSYPTCLAHHDWINCVFRYRQQCYNVWGRLSQPARSKHRCWGWGNRW